MINLKKYKDYWESVCSRVDDAVGFLPVTIDKDMSKKIQALPNESVTLFVFPPMADSIGRNPDAFKERNQCVVFLMKKYNPMKMSSFDVLEQTQMISEDIKKCLLNDRLCSCCPLDLDLSTFETAPETELYGIFAGWSIAFNINTSGL